MGHSEVVKELILAGADPNITDCNRVTPLFISIASSNLFDAGALMKQQAHEQIVVELLNAGADPNIVPFKPACMPRSKN